VEEHALEQEQEQEQDDRLVTGIYIVYWNSYADENGLHV